MSELLIHIPMGATQDAYINAVAREILIVGPRRRGKSYASIAAMVEHARKCPPESWPIPWAICRDTAKNLERTTVPSMEEWEAKTKEKACQMAMQQAQAGATIKGQKVTLELAEAFCRGVRAKKWVTFRQNKTEAHIGDGTNILVLAYLFGMDEVKDISKFQSLNLGGVWFEEVAPAADDDIGGGIQEDAWGTALSSLSYNIPFRRAQISCNPPDEDHWVWRRFVVDPQPDVACFRIPRDENKENLPANFDATLERALAHNPQLHRRLVLGLPGFIQKGKPVAENFSEERHVSKVPLMPRRNAELQIWWDFGHNPTATGVQRTASGQYLCLFCLTSENTGLEEFIDDVLKSYLQRRFPWDLDLFHIGDPSADDPEQSSINRTFSRIIVRKLGGRWRSGPQKWPARREAVLNLLGGSCGKEALFLLDPKECKPLIKALRGGWHYHGNSTVERPVKNEHSHPGDTVSYGAAVNLGDYGRPRQSIKVPRPGYAGLRPRPSLPAGVPA